MFEYRSGNKEYLITDYDPKWIKGFLVLKNSLEHVFDTKALQIEHVGSTSIVDMKAKPIIDVLVIVRDVNNLRSEKSKMSALGYTAKENYIAPDSLFFCKEVNGKRLALIHVLPVGHPRIAEFIDKRDYLRAYPEEARRYERIKIDLAKRYPTDYMAYKREKSRYLNTDLTKKIMKWKGSLAA
jgi:GrpB-like predicted nucleotidyltransferase (UPF0157 family)